MFTFVVDWAVTSKGIFDSNYRPNPMNLDAFTTFCKDSDRCDAYIRYNGKMVASCTVWKKGTLFDLCFHSIKRSMDEASFRELIKPENFFASPPA